MQVEGHSLKEEYSADYDVQSEEDVDCNSDYRKIAADLDYNSYVVPVGAYVRSGSLNWVPMAEQILEVGPCLLSDHNI